MKPTKENVELLISQYRTSGSKHDDELAEQVTQTLGELLEANGELRDRYEHHWLYFKGLNEYSRGHNEEAITFHRQALDGAIRHHDELMEGKILMQVGSCLTHLARMEEALPTRYRAIEIFRRHDDLNNTAKCLMNLGVTLLGLAEYDRAQAMILESIELYEHGVDDESMHAHAYFVLASTFYYRGEAVKGMEYAMKAYELALQIGDDRVARGCSGNIGVSYLNAGDYDSARTWNERALSYFEPTDTSSDYYNELLNQMLIDFKVRKDPELLVEISTFMMQWTHTSGDNSTGQVVATLCLEAIDLERFDLLKQFVQAWRDNVLGSQNVVARLTFLLCELELEVRESVRPDALARCENLIAEAKQRQQPSDVMQGYRLLSIIHEAVGDHAEALHALRTHMTLTTEAAAARSARSLAMIGVEHDRRETTLLTQRQRDLLESVMPTQVADRLMKGETLIADSYDNVSVLFMDIVAFTDLSTRIAPSLLVHLLDAVFSRVDAIMARHGLTKIKTIGDAYMAVAGIPNIQDDHTLRAANAAKDLVTSLDDIEVPEFGTVQIRVGLSCGSVVAGVIGRQRAQYDVWGDTVNVAARMEAASEAGRIHVSELFADTLAADAAPAFEGKDVVIVAGANKLRMRGTMNIKGKGEMKTYWLETA